MTAYYNEHDPFAAAWLRELIKAGQIAPGIVDERSIEDVPAKELFRYTQCHFFAGIGVWSYALRQAGWPDDRPIWTGSCPCQPFSAAGKGAGFDDERHLWPAFHHLIEQCRPAIALGEQVASKDGLDWIDLVQTDLEGAGYACAAVDTCAAGFGAPHIRQRLYWVGKRLADAAGAGLQRGWSGQEGDGRITPRQQPERLCDAGGLADSYSRQCNWLADGEGRDGHRTQTGWEQSYGEPECHRATRGLADANDTRSQGFTGMPERSAECPAWQGGVAGERPGPTNGFWRDADWLLCRDGKWRPVEPGTFPLVDGAAARVGRSSNSGAPIDAYSGEARVMRLRGYGNAINAAQAQAFIEAVMSITPQKS